MGTPDFAAAILKALAEDKRDIVLVVTQPDRPKGRSGKAVFSDVKECALRYSLPVFQPQKVREPEAVARIAEFKPDIIVVAAFGQILPKELLDLPQYGCINIHASLLPKYRGASPIQQAIIDGEEKTGITVMQMDEGLDTGDILFQLETKIDEHETGGSLFDRLSTLGAEAALKALDLIEAGEAKRTPQDESASTYAGLIKKDFGKLDFTRKSAAECVRLIRALNPWPSAFARIGDKQVKFFDSRVGREGSFGAPGTITNVTKTDFSIQCTDAELVILKLQPEGKKPMDAGAFMRGYRLEKGDVLS